MDIIKMLQDLRSDREQIEEAILTLERLARGQGRRRGRPPNGCPKVPTARHSGNLRRSWYSVPKQGLELPLASESDGPPRGRRKHSAGGHLSDCVAVSDRSQRNHRAHKNSIHQERDMA
jgi:hypothetical protein